MTINGSMDNTNWTFKLEAYETSYSIPNNNSVVRVDMYLGRARTQGYLGGDWNGSITVDGQTQYLSGHIHYPTYINGGEWLYLGTKDFTVGHNTDGTKTAGVSASFSSSDFTPHSGSANGNLPLTTIPRASSITATNADIESATSININRASSSFKHTLKYNFGSLSGTIATNVDTSYGWTIPTTFYAQIPNTKTGTCTITCETYSGSTLIGTKTTTFTVTANESLCKPILTASIVDINQDTIDLTGDDEKLVKYHSMAQISYSATSQNSSTITKITINDVEVTNSPYNIENVASSSFVVKATDSRGYVTTVTLTPNMIDYVPLTNSPSFYRTAPTTGEMSLEFSGNYFNDTFGDVSNTLNIKWYYKLRNDENWITGGTLILDTDYKIINNTYHSGHTNYERPISLGNSYDYQKQYDFKIEIEDALEQVVIIQSVSKGQPIVNWDDDHFNINGDITQYEQSLNIPNVIDNLDSNSTTDAPSQRAVNQLATYSTTEIKIGTWINGKPIYRKVVNAGSLPNNTSMDVSLSVFNAENKFITQLYCIGASSQGEYIKIPYYASDQNYVNILITSTHTIRIQTGADRSRFTGYIIVEYTKSAD